VQIARQRSPQVVTTAVLRLLGRNRLLGMGTPSDEPPPGLDVEELEHLLTRVQDGVVSRRQLRGLGARDHDIARLVRRRELTVVHPGVYVNHNGEPTWEQRAWAAVLACWPAALCDESALPSPQRAGPIHVAISHRRTLRAPRFVVVHRMAGFDRRVRWLAAPPRIRVEEAALDVAIGRSTVPDQFRVLADVCQTRETNARRLLESLDARKRAPGRPLLRQLLEDLDGGACSVLEREYLELERRHGLPVADRQRRATLAGTTVYRDVRYAGCGVVVELDGGAFHDNAAARDRDARRDLDTKVAEEATTVRLTYGQVFDHGCETIRKVALLLERRGWAGPFVVCPTCP
jgi:hypothetical protein